MTKLLLIEDDENMIYMIKNSLEELIGGYKVYAARNGVEGLAVLADIMPDVIVSDIEMPVLDGIEMVKKIRLSNSRIPILFATGRTSFKAVIDGYAAGVNNYIKKPYMPEELDAHIKALLDKSRYQPVETKQELFQIGKYTFDSTRYYLGYESKRQHLTKTESQILALLCVNMGKVVLREEILTKHWPEADTFTSRSLDVFISKIRTYLSADPSVVIKNIKKVGLMLEVG